MLRTCPFPMVASVLLALAAWSSLPPCANAQVANYPQLSPSDWPWWRGPTQDGVVRSEAKFPQSWSQNENIAWSVDVPGRGNGSPIVVGDQVILATCDEPTGSQSLISFHRQTGQQLWHTIVHPDGAMRKNNRSTGASSTPACDGQRLYITFANHDKVIATALSMKGEKLWQTPFTQYQIHQGYGASPALYGDLVLVAADSKGGGAVAALRRSSGELVWKRERPSNPNYTSPIVFQLFGKDQLIMTGCDLITSLDPLTGQTHWEVAGATTECVTSTVTDGKHVYSSGGYPKNHMSAVRADGSNEIVWENKERVYVPSLIYKDGYLYGVLDAGIAMCWEAATGKEMWKERLKGDFSSSPVLVGDAIYVTSEFGDTFVLKVSPTGCERLASNKLGDEVFATPTFSAGQIFMRVAYQSADGRQEKLVSIGK